MEGSEAGVQPLGRPGATSCLNPTQHSTPTRKDDSALEYALAANRDDMVALLDMDPEKRLKSGSAKERERTVAVIAAQAAYAPHKQRMAAKKKKVAMTVGKGQTARARPTGAGPPTRRGGAKGGTKAAKKVSVGFGR